MHTLTPRVLFILFKTKGNINKKVPVYCRITYRKRRAQFSTGIMIRLCDWDQKQQKAIKCDDKGLINHEISGIRNKVQESFIVLKLKAPSFDVHDIKDLCQGKEFNEGKYLIQNFKDYLKQLRQLVGVEIQMATYKKFEYALDHTKDFITAIHNKNDILLSKLNLKLIEDFEFYLKTEKKLGRSTLNKIIQRFRKPIKVAISNGDLKADPFILYRSKHVRTKVIFLSTDELKRFETHRFAQKRLSYIKDLFVFSCYTGLPYNELMRLSNKHINLGFDQNLWIEIDRKKTGRSLSIPLLPKALEILKKYIQTEGEIFPKISNQKYNSYLKEIADIVGIDKRLTTHTARRTFASTVLLYNDVPMEIVSELLGHSNLKITQESYGKIINKKISTTMQRIGKLI